MRLAIPAIAALVAASSLSALAASPLPQGKFAGTGSYLGPKGSTGSYTISATVDGDRMVAIYRYQEGSSPRREETYTLTAKADGTFTIAGKDRGRELRGRCDGPVCSYAASFPGGEVMELIRFKEDAIEKVGTKTFGDVSVTWTESLERAP